MRITRVRNKRGLNTEVPASLGDCGPGPLNLIKLVAPQRAIRKIRDKEEKLWGTPRTFEQSAKLG